MWLDVLDEKHYKAVYEIAIREEPYNSSMSYEQFVEVMKESEGYVVVAPNGELAGCISFSDYVPESNVVIHCVIDRKYRKRWLNKKILKTVFTYVYEYLCLPRVSGFCVEGVSDEAGEFLLRLGFKQEGIIRKSVRLKDGLYNIKLFGLLKEECKWI